MAGGPEETDEQSLSQKKLVRTKENDAAEEGGRPDELSHQRLMKGVLQFWRYAVLSDLASDSSGLSPLGSDESDSEAEDLSPQPWRAVWCEERKLWR